MRKVTVPIDMSSEQKEILGIVSKRQVIYLFIGGGIIYSYAPFVFNLFSNPLIGIIAIIISAIPVIAIVLLLGFWRREKYSLFFDKYLLLKLGYKTQIGVWRKGSAPKDWMVEQE